jgi:hypothetical protein
VTIKQIVVAGVFSLLLTTGVYYLSLLEHEHAHVQIYKYYGVSSQVEMNLFEGVTKPTSPIPPEYSSQIQLAHGINEAVGYQLIPFLIVIVFLLSMIFFMQIKT